MYKRQEVECGNYREQDLGAAKKDIAVILELLKDYPVEKLTYPCWIERNQPALASAGFFFFINICMFRQNITGFVAYLW